jgi:methyl-accepting chemotaxis protein
MPESAAQAEPVVFRSPKRGTVQSLRLRIFGRRYRILIHPRYQLRSALRSLVGPVALVVSLVFVLDRVNHETARDLEQMAPFMRNGLERWNRVALISMLVGSALFLVGVFFLDLLATQRTAGSLLNLRRRLSELSRGRLATLLRLRRKDNFPELEEAFNEAVASIRTRVEGEVATLGRLAAQARALLSEVDAGQTARAKAQGLGLERSLEELKSRKAQLLER